MVSKYKYRNVTWVNLESPTRAEILTVAEEFDLPDLMSEELAISTLRSKVDFYEREKLIYLVLHFPFISHGKNNTEQEIDFVIGKNFIITTHYEKIDSLTYFAKIFGHTGILDRGNAGDHAGHVFILIMKELYKNLLENLENINDSLRAIEDNIFKGKQAEAVGIISETNRKFLNFKQALRHHGEILDSFEFASFELFGQNFKHNFQTTTSEYNRVKNTLDIGKEILNDLRTTNDSLLTTKNNKTISRLTAMTLALFPITLITGIFSMNVSDGIVFIKDERDFILVVIFMVVVGLITLVYFKGKKWL